MIRTNLLVLEARDLLDDLLALGEGVCSDGVFVHSSEVGLGVAEGLLDFREVLAKVAHVGFASLLEAFCVGTAVVVTAVARIGWHDQDLVLPEYGGDYIGPIAHALDERIVDIQEGRVEWKGWSVPCRWNDGA